MNTEERKVFWNTLCSLTGEDIDTDQNHLSQTIKYPKFLYRYRPVNTKNLEALRTNRLYFSSANYYDDPFDTFLHIDIGAIRNVYLNAFQNPENIKITIDSIKPFFGSLFSRNK